MSSRKRIAVAALILAAIVGGGMALRLYGIGRSGFWLDEAFSELRTRGTLGDTLHEAVASEGSPPLYLATLYVWRHIVGTGEWQFRLLSAILDGLTIIAVFAFAREMLNRRASLIAAGMYAVSSFAVYYAQEARQYALLTLMVVLSSWFFYRIAVSHHARRPFHYILYIAATAAALYTFPYAVFVAAAQGLFLAARIFAALLRARDGDSLLRPVMALACLVIAVAVFSPYIPVLMGRAAQLRGMQGPGASGLEADLHVAAQMPGIARSMIYGSYISYMGRGAIANIFALLFIALPVVLGIANLRGPGGARLFMASAFVVPLAGVALLPFRAQVFEAKHIGFLLPFFIVAACALFSRHFVGRKRLLANLLPVAEGCLVVALFAGSQAFDLRDYYAAHVGKEAWREITPLLAEKLADGDAVIFSPYYSRVPCEYYLKGKVEITNSINPFTERVERWRMKDGGFGVPVLVPRVEQMNTGETVTSDDMEAFLKMYQPKRVWLVVNRSNVAQEVEGGYEMLEDSLKAGYNEVYPEGFKEEYPGGVGTVRVRLFVKR